MELFIIKWAIIGFISEVFMYFGVYRPYWFKYYDKDVSIEAQIVLIVVCITLGYIAFICSLIIFAYNYDDLWKK